MQKKSSLLGCLSQIKLSCRKDAPLSSSRSVGVRDIRGAIKNFAAPIPRIETLRGDEARHSAFTLIELLVVVLIIGILAAVALPQYQKAVEKSKAVQAQTLLKSVYQAAKAYKLANGSWPASFDELVVDIPWTGNTNWAKLTAATQGKSNADWSIQLATGHDYGFGVTVGRISGPYAGAAFAITDTPRTNSSNGTEAPVEEMICIEGHTGNAMNYNFAKSNGDYCTKLFKGTLVPTGHASYYYKLP